MTRKDASQPCSPRSAARTVLACAATLTFVLNSSCSDETGDKDASGSERDAGAASGGGSNTSLGGNSTISINSLGGAGQAGDEDVTNGKCDQVSITTSLRPAEVLLLLDRSGSMGSNFIESSVTRWDGVVPVLSQAVVETDTSVSWGLKLFPEGRVDVCSAESVTDVIDAPITPLGGQAVVSEIEMATPFGRGTPTNEAIDASVAYLSSLPSDNPKYILLATDGLPSCPAPQEARPLTVASAAAAFAEDIPVFVVGVLDPETNDGTIDTLNNIAIAGGKPRAPGDDSAEQFYLTSSASALLSALTEITGEIATCVFPFESAPPDPGNIAVKINGDKVAQDTTRANGWDYANEESTAIELYGDACESIKMSGKNMIDVIFGCPGVQIR